MDGTTGSIPQRLQSREDEKEVIMYLLVVYVAKRILSSCRLDEKLTSVCFIIPDEPLSQKPDNQS